MNPEWWVGQGVLGVVLLIFGWAVWRVILWSKIVVVEPVVKAHLDLISTLNAHIPKQTTAIDNQTVAIDKMSEAIDHQSVEVATQTKILEDRTPIFGQITQAQKELKDSIDKLAKTQGS